MAVALALKTISLACFAAASVAIASEQAGVPAPAGGFPALSEGEILVLGEMHGSNEVPRYFLEQVRREARRRPVTVGLEIGPGSARLDCRRDDPRLLPPGWANPAQDGRTSRAMRALLCALRAPSLAQRVRVVFLDDDVRGDNFDRTAAARFRQVLAGRGGIGLILTGNFHARNNAGSLAAHLRLFNVSVRTATISAAVAETWMCAGRPSTCGAQRASVNFCSSEPSDRADLRWYRIEDARFNWDYCVSLPRLTPSAPAREPAR